MDIEESFVPQEIKDKIEMLNKMIGEAESLNKEITEWYHEALLDMDSELNVDDELFDASNALSVEGIDFNAIMEGLSIVSIFIETYGERKMNNKSITKLLETVAFLMGYMFCGTYTTGTYTFPPIRRSICFKRRHKHYKAII